MVMEMVEEVDNLPLEEVGNDGGDGDGNGDGGGDSPPPSDPGQPQHY